MMYSSLSHSQKCLQFIDLSPDPYHAVREGRERLRERGYEEIQEYMSWKKLLKPGGKVRERERVRK